MTTRRGKNARGATCRLPLHLGSSARTGLIDRLRALSGKPSHPPTRACARASDQAREKPTVLGSLNESIMSRVARG